MYAIVLALLAPAAEPTLEARIAPLVKEHKGKVAIAVKHLGTGESWFLNADDVMPTASLIKLPVMVEAYAQEKDGKLKFDTKLTLTKDDKVPGSGILTSHFSDGATFPVKDAVRLMIAFSDNTATNMVLDQTGIKEVNARMVALGFKNSKVNAKVFKGSTTSVDPAATKQYGLGSTTAREMVDLLALIDAGKVVSPEACKEMVAHLKACNDTNMFARHLPAGASLAHKTGAVSAARTEAGIAYLKSGPVALCVLTNDNDDKRWTKDNAAEALLANVAKAVYDHFGEKPKK